MRNLAFRGLRLPRLGAMRSGVSILALFTAGVVGVWFDPSDLSTLFQDSLGTTPVTAAGQPVGLMLDKSGNGNHAVQATAAKRPTYQTSGGLHWLAFDGVDDSMATAAIDFTGTDKVSVFAGVRLLTPRSANAAIWQIGDAVSTATDALIRILSGDGSTDAVRASFTGAASNQTTRVATAYPSTGIYTAIFDGAVTGAAEISFRRNGAVIDTGSATDSGVTSIGSQVLTIGQQGSNSVFTKYDFYGLIAPGKLVSDAEIASTEPYMAGKSGVTL